jgi:putative membrane protein
MSKFEMGLGTAMTEERVIWDAEFNPRVTTYWLLNGALIMIATIVGIPLVPLWFIIGWVVTGRYLKSHRCTLTNRSVKVARGVFVKREQTIPLDRITDVSLVQGPVMRVFDIEALSVETAGQSTPGSLVQLAGIKDGRKFRDAVLKQRDLVVGSEEDRRGPTRSELAPASTEDQRALLEDIRDTLRRIESKIAVVNQ